MKSPLTPSAQIAYTHLKAATGIDEALALADALFWSIGDGAITSDAHGRVSRINIVALRMLGYKKEEVLGKPYIEVIKNTDAQGNVIEPMERSITQVFVTGQPVSRTTYYECKNGTLLPVAMTVSPIILDGIPSGAIEVFRDVSREQEIDRMKSEFISIASHQLRTPLTAVKTYAHLLEGGYAGTMTPSQQEFMETILSAADHMNTLIDTFLDISRIETGQLKLDPKPMSIKKLINEIIDEFRQVAKNKGITMTVQISETLPAKIYADPSLLKEVYSNLLSNAIKYTPPGGKVKLDVASEPKSVVLIIKDNGYGIPKAQKQRIFDKFFRASNISAVETNGSGLGLYMIKKIAENMGGDITFKSREGKGSTFTFTFPKLLAKNSTLNHKNV